MENGSRIKYIGDLIGTIRRYRGIQQKALAAQIGVTPMTMNKYEKGKFKSIPSYDKLEKIAEALNVDVKVFYDTENVEDFKLYLNEQKVTARKHIDVSDNSLRSLSAVESNISFAPDIEEGLSFHTVPVYGSVPAGKPVEAFQNKIDEIKVVFTENERGRPYFGLQVHGDSMYPNYMEGDIVIVEATSDFNSGDDVVAYVGDDFEATLKRIHKRDGEIILEPINKEYRSRKFNKDTVSLTVVGVVRQLIRRM